ncbi:MAG TPA: MalM family protein [Pseudomonas sp.]|nr:MalM family protein [Pseudomonas sp.]
MTPFKLSLCLLGLLLAGCASEPLRRIDALNASPAPLQASLSAAQRSLDAAPSCCASLQQLPFTRIGADFSGEVLIDQNSPAFEFDSGKSFLRAFQLPADSKSFEIRLYSQAGDTVLAPNAMLLDSQYRVTRLLGPDDFVYAPAAGLKSDSLDARLRVDRLYKDNPGNEHYLVLYSSSKQMSGQTVIEHPAKAYARALGNQPPNIPDPVVKHAPVGVLKMVLIEDQVAGQTANTYVPPYSIGQTMGNTVPSVPAPAVLPETQAYYRQGIDAALLSQDLSRALRLADEAERVGDASAKAYLLERIQIK